MAANCAAMHIPTTTRGSLALAALMARPDTRVSEFARQLNVDRGALARWAKGTRRPEAHFRAALDRLHGISADDWLTDEERLIAFGGGDESGGGGAVEHGGGSSCAL